MTSDELTKRRKQLGLSQAAIAQVFDVHPSTWAHWEQGAQAIRMPRVLRWMLMQLADDKAACADDAQCWQDQVARWTAGDWSDEA